MGGRNSAAAKEKVYSYHADRMIHGVKVLVGINGEHSLPVESYTSNAYIKLKPDGTFHEMRFYNSKHEIVLEVAYHPEPNINNHNYKENVLHVHIYKTPGDFAHRPPHLITREEYLRYKKYLIGVPAHDKW